MTAVRSPRLARALILFALLAATMPSLTAIADAWRLDRISPFAHVESETGTDCTLVHGEVCSLCAASETAAGPARRADLVETTADGRDTGRVFGERSIATHVRRPASSRAPPTGTG